PFISPTETSQQVVLPTDSIIQTQCPEISTQFTPGDFTKGILVYDHGSALLNLQTGEKSSLDGGATISPARDQVEIYTGDPNTLKPFLIVRKIGDPTPIELQFPKGTINDLGWLDEERLLFQVESAVSPPYGLVTLNPFTGETQQFSPQFPNLSPDDEYWYPLGPAVFDRTLDYVLYISQEAKAKTNQYVFWQISARKMLASLPGSSYRWPELVSGQGVEVDSVSHHPPAWSPDDTRVAVISAAPQKSTGVDEIFALTKNGEIQRLTYFAKHYDKAKIRTLSWSPDGKSIAFWATLDPGPYPLEPHTDQNERLAILNTETLDLTIYCISGDSFGLEHMTANFIATEPPGPVWSPDGKQIVIENRYTEKDGRTIILDIPGNTAVQIGQNLAPVGWMTGMP
ncbi:MAG: hypothetical protein WA821_22715, partial [Anaerolineales bacterium]